MANATTEQTEQPVRSRLLDAAEQIASRDGVSNLTLEGVAREAGTSKGGLLYHFPSKSALIMAIVERRAEQCEASQALNCTDDTTPGAYTRAYLQTRTASLEPDRKPFQAAIVAA